MAKRRGNNEGSIYQKRSGSWRAQVSIHGRRISFTGKSRAECVAWLRKTNLQIDQGLTFSGADTSLKNFLAGWLVSASGSRVRGTIERYEWIIEHEIVPSLGNYKLKDIRADLVQNFYDLALKNGRSPDMVRSTHKVLSTALTHAVQLGMIGRNPCKATSPPKADPKEMQILDEDQIQVLLTNALSRKDPFFPLYYLAIHTGMRQGELVGLKWEDIDWKGLTLEVRRQIVRYQDGSYAITKPKSRSAFRTIALGKQAIEVLHKQEARVWQLRKKPHWQEMDLVFPTKFGTPVQGCNIRRSFRSLIEASKLPKIRFHDLRHTAASMMLNNGIPVLVASRRLGHAKASITLDVYGHLLPGRQEEAARLMDDLLPMSVEIAPKTAPARNKSSKKHKIWRLVLD